MEGAGSSSKDLTSHNLGMAIQPSLVLRPEIILARGCKHAEGKLRQKLLAIAAKQTSPPNSVQVSFSGPNTSCRKMTSLNVKVAFSRAQSKHGFVRLLQAGVGAHAEGGGDAHLAQARREVAQRPLPPLRHRLGRRRVQQCPRRRRRSSRRRRPPRRLHAPPIGNALGRYKWNHRNSLK